MQLGNHKVVFRIMSIDPIVQNKLYILNGYTDLDNIFYLHVSYTVPTFSVFNKRSIKVDELYINLRDVISIPIPRKSFLGRFHDNS